MESSFGKWNKVLPDNLKHCLCLPPNLLVFFMFDFISVCLSLSSSPAADLLFDEAGDTTSDLMLAQMLQMQYDREFDDQLRREEKKFNGDSKGSTTILVLLLLLRVVP